ncbi:hypothetical protein [Marinicellulosiphila megalodicopiae]|uniref:hypothetical protein n=1 Tax=Marinicellulosiphila megalodicopiae TaxID=2724896 RepID=UPI003BAEBF2E
MSIKKRYIQLAAVALSSVTFTAFGGTNSELLVGNWQCGYSMDMEGITMDLDMSVSYEKNSTSSASARIDLVNPMMAMDLAYQVEASGTWYIEGNTIYETLTKGHFESLKPSPYDALMSEDDLMPFGVEQSSTIVELTSEKLIMTTGDIAINCTRN